MGISWGRQVLPSVSGSVQDEQILPLTKEKVMECTRETLKQKIRMFMNNGNFRSQALLNFYRGESTMAHKFVFPFPHQYLQHWVECENSVNKLQIIYDEYMLNERYVSDMNYESVEDKDKDFIVESQRKLLFSNDPKDLYTKLYFMTKVEDALTKCKGSGISVYNLLCTAGKESEAKETHYLLISRQSQSGINEQMPKNLASQQEALESFYDHIKTKKCTKRHLVLVIDSQYNTELLDLVYATYIMSTIVEENRAKYECDMKQLKGADYKQVITYFKNRLATLYDAFNLLLKDNFGKSTLSHGNCILVWDTQRFSRSLFKLKYTLRIILEYGINIRCLMLPTGIDLKDQIGGHGMFSSTEQAERFYNAFCISMMKDTQGLRTIISNLKSKPKGNKKLVNTN
jgi:hypothetical protein